MTTPDRNNTFTEMPGTLITLRDVSRQLRISVRAVYRLIAKGDLPPPVKVGGATRFFDSDLHRYLESLNLQRDRR